MNGLFEDISPMTNDLVRLAPLALDDVAALTSIATEPGIWTYFTKKLRHLDEHGVEHYVRNLLQERVMRQTFAFVIRRPASDTPVGVVKYENLNSKHRRLDIGGFWLHPQHRGKGLMQAAVFELLELAFVRQNVRRVGFLLNAENNIAKRAVLRWGATPEGVLRRYLQTEPPTCPDITVFSLIDDEWPSIRLARFGGRAAAS